MLLINISNKDTSNVIRDIYDILGLNLEYDKEGINTLYKTKSLSIRNVYVEDRSLKYKCFNFNVNNNDTFNFLVTFADRSSDENTDKYLGGSNYKILAEGSSNREFSEECSEINGGTIKSFYVVDGGNFPIPQRFYTVAYSFHRIHKTSLFYLPSYYLLEEKLVAVPIYCDFIYIKILRGLTENDFEIYYSTTGFVLKNSGKNVHESNMKVNKVELKFKTNEMPGAFTFFYIFKYFSQSNNEAYKFMGRALV